VKVVTAACCGQVKRAGTLPPGIGVQAPRTQQPPSGVAGSCAAASPQVSRKSGTAVTSPKNPGGSYDHSLDPAQLRL
jgi:hypothetical protein